MNQSAILGDRYELLDSGALMKLERIGDTIVARPSSLCIWNKSRPEDEWKRADAVYTPKKGWKTKAKGFESWEVQFPSFRLRLRLQDNGQVGLFPEHAEYLDAVLTLLTSRPAGEARELSALNLFAFTGMASTLLLNSGCRVCHVDLSKKALTWAKDNFELNNVPSGRYRLIPEDTVTFIEREKRRGSRYDLLIVDPPSFSRSGAKTSWKLEEIITKMMQTAADLLAERGLLVFSCHHSALNAVVLRNLAMDIHTPRLTVIKYDDLSISEPISRRKLPAGSYVLVRRE